MNTGRSIHDLGSRVEGIIAAEYLEKLKADTHRGMRGRAERGLAAGGTAYGYRTVEIPSGKVDAHGRNVPADSTRVAKGSGGRESCPRTGHTRETRRGGTRSRSRPGAHPGARRRALRDRAGHGARVCGDRSRRPGSGSARLREIDQELESLGRFAAKTGQVETASALYHELQRERAQVAGRLGKADCELDPEVVRAVVLERVRQMRAAFDGSDVDRRAAFRALLGDRRMVVGPHPERGFQVEGLFQLSLETERAAGGGPLSAARMFGSGGRI